MNLEERCDAFVKLRVALNENKNQDVEKLYNKQYTENHWFIPQFVKFAIESIANMLTQAKVYELFEKYKSCISNVDKKDTIAVISAGNIPAAGFHDFFSVLFSGYCYQGKLSKNDNIILPYIANKLIEIEPKFKNKITFVDKITNFKAIIASGSNNSARYFEYYFGKYPNILRRNRNSMAVLSGNETKKQLKNLILDIILYFGLGCRSVSLLFVPKNYNFNLFFEIIEATVKDFMIDAHHHYLNNILYYKAIFLMNKINFMESDAILLVNKRELFSPISVLNYTYHQDIEEINQFIKANKESLQCVATEISGIEESIHLGQTQTPQLDNFADNIDVIKWCIRLQ